MNYRTINVSIKDQVNQQFLFFHNLQFLFVKLINHSCISKYQGKYHGKHNVVKKMQTGIKYLTSDKEVHVIGCMSLFVTLKSCYF